MIKFPVMYPIYKFLYTPRFKSKRFLEAERVVSGSGSLLTSRPLFLVRFQDKLQLRKEH